MLSGIVGLIFTVVGIGAAIFALLSDELKNNKSLRYVIIATLFGLTVYAAIGSLISLSINEQDQQSSLSSTVTAYETIVPQYLATITSNPTPVTAVTVVTAVTTVTAVSEDNVVEQPQIFYRDNFNSIRNDGIGLKVPAPNGIITPTIDTELGFYNLEIDSTAGRSFIDITTSSTIRNFDAVIKFGEIINRNYLSFNIIFRVATHVEAEFGIFIAGDRKGEYYMSVNKEEITGGNISFQRLEEIRIKCIDTTCEFFINNNTQPFEQKSVFVDNSGFMRLEVSGQGTINIDEILISEFK